MQVCSVVDRSSDALYIGHLTPINLSQLYISTEEK